MTSVELIYDHDCPNVPKARAQLLRAFADVGIPPRWSEWERGDPGAQTACVAMVLQPSSSMVET